MTELKLEEKIIDTFKKAFNNMTRNQKENLLMYGEGMIAILEANKDSEAHEEK